MRSQAFPEDAPAPAAAAPARDGTPRPAFPEVPVFRPPMIERPAVSPGVIQGIRMFARDILSVFPQSAYASRSFRFRVLRREVVIVNHPEAVREAFVERHEALQRKSPQMRAALEPLVGDGLIVSDGQTWRARRSAVAGIVHARNLAAFFPVMAEVAFEWRDNWRRLPPEPVDVLAEMGSMAAEIIARAVFGTRLGREHTGEIVAAFAEYQRRFDRVALGALAGLPEWLPRLPRRGIAASVGRIHRVIDGLIDELVESRDEPEVADTFVVRMLNATDPDGRPFDRDAIRNEAMVTFMAGHETTANTLAWALYILSEADWARERLRAECDAVLAGRVPTLQDLKRLAYTRAVVEETLRLYPPVPLLGRQAREDTTLDGCPVARGTQVTVAPWLLHRNPRIWERPDDFIPERFLDDAGRPGKYAYVPFAIGPRTCPGLTFGLTEAIVCLSVLASTFDLRLAPGHTVRSVARGSLRPGDAMPMIVTPRGEEG